MIKYKFKKQIVLGYDESGKRCRKWIYANTKADLLRLEVEAKEQFRYTPVSLDITFGEYADTWYQTYKANRSVKTCEMYATTLKLTSGIRQIPLKKVTATDLQALVNNNWNHAETCKKLCMVLKAIFRRAQNDGIIKANPAADLERPEVIQGEKKALTESEKDAVRTLMAPGNKVLTQNQKMLLSCLYYFGLRPEEARGLMFTDFDLKSMELTVRRAVTFDVNRPVVKDTKTHNIRVLPIPYSFLPILKQCEKKGIYLISTDDGQPVTKTMYRLMWDRIKAAINVALGGSDTLSLVYDLKPYSFRRNYATMLYYSDISIKKAAYYMGHADTKMILQVYAQIEDEKEGVELLRDIN